MILKGPSAILLKQEVTRRAISGLHVEPELMVDLYFTLSQYLGLILLRSVELKFGFKAVHLRQNLFFRVQNFQALPRFW
jgi:hypothetical protein